MTDTKKTNTEKPRIAGFFYDDSGHQVHRWGMTPSDLLGVVQLPLGPDRVLPVIFVPGIMGSNLKSTVADKKSGDPIWRLDVSVGIPWSLLGKVVQGPGTRQSMLHPMRCTVDDGGNVPDVPAGMVRDPSMYRQRKWGEVGEGSYHSFLLWLEETLNGQGWNPALWKDFNHVGVQATPAPGQPPSPRVLPPGLEMRMPGLPGTVERDVRPEPVTSDELLARARFLMPVHACGYNWLDSNDEAAKQLARRIDQVMTLYGARCQQVALVTHSMGGLVARRCQQLPGMAQKIAGIVHGVMPAEGAPVAYRRCKVGMADEGDSVAASIGSLIIGNNGRDVTAVFAQAPGALQLLPTSGYGTNWLKVRDEQWRVLHKGPMSNPYNDIYRRNDHWWGLVREEWLKPAEGMEIEWDTYTDNISSAETFHQKIADDYHPNTYVYYGTGVPSFEGVTWDMQPPPPAYASFRDEPPGPEQVKAMGFHDIADNGRNPLPVGGHPAVSGPYSSVQIRTPVHWYLRCSSQDGDGDGTVPVSSGSAPLRRDRRGNIRQQFRLSGFEHEGSYKHADAQQVTLYALIKIAAKARVSA